MDRVERADAVGREYRRLEERVLAWATGDDDVRGAVVLGSRAREDHPADEWADLDVVVATDAAQRLVTDRTWLKTIGEPWMSFVEGAAGADSPELRVMFAGGFDVDFACMSLDRLRTASDADPQMVAIAFGRGCRILVDKDGLLHDLTGLAVATLRYLLIDPRLLQRLTRVGVEALNCRYIFAGHITDRRDTGSCGNTVDVHGARTAHRDATTEFGALKFELVANHPQQRRVRLAL